VISALSDLRVVAVVVRSRAKGTRGRAEALELVLRDLTRRGVREVVLETSGGDAARDRSLIGALERSGMPKVQDRHLRPNDEPLLWVADYLVWTHGRSKRWTRVGGSSRCCCHAKRETRLLAIRRGVGLTSAASALACPVCAEPTSAQLLRVCR